jgi:hypothetical protein
MTTFFTVMQILVGAEYYAIVYKSEQHCAESIHIVYAAASTKSDDVAVSCHRSDVLSSTIRPRARGEK